MNYSELSTAIQDYCQNSETTFVSHINDFIIAAEDKVFLVASMPAFWKSDSASVTVASQGEYTLAAGVIDIFSARIGETAVVSPETVEDGPSRYLLLKDYDFLLEAYPGSASAATTGVPKYYAIAGATASEATATSTGVFFEGFKGVTGLDSTSDISVGMSVSGTGIAEGAVVAKINSETSLNMSLNADAGGSVSLTFAVTNPTLSIRFGPIPDAVYPFTVDYYGKTAVDSITAGSVPSAPLTTKTWLSVTAPDVLLYGSLVQAYTFMKGEPDVIGNYDTKFNEGLVALKNLGEGRQVSDAYTGGAARFSAQ